MIPPILEFGQQSNEFADQALTLFQLAALGLMRHNRYYMNSALSLPQCVGYVALVLGVTSFLQKSDRRLKIISIGQCIAYAAHFYLMHDLAPAAGNIVSIARNLISLRTKSVIAAWILSGVVIILGYFTIKSPAGLLPIVATVIAIWGMLRFDGVRFRLTMLFCTGMWLANNIICHSIGGMILESFVGAANTFTICRLVADARTAASAPPAGIADPLIPYGIQHEHLYK